jgi:hypothetical protein
LSEEPQEVVPKIRSAFYIDGFNLYHAIDEFNEPFLKWISYWTLAQILIPKKTEILVSVIWCTANRKDDYKKSFRHKAMRTAQELHGVSVKIGHFVGDDRSCHSCGNTWKHPTEKEGDINVAIHLIRDGFHNVYDHAYLVTADSDQLATVRMFKEEFPDKKITIVAPPNRPRSEVLHEASGKNTISLNKNHIEKSIMDHIIIKENKSARRPDEYKPPTGWVHPKNRSK